MSSQVRSWTPSDVEAWLQALDLDAVGQVFRDSGVTGADLLNLTDEDMTDLLGLNKLQIRKIRAGLAAGPMLPQAHQATGANSAAMGVPAQAQAAPAVVYQQPMPAPQPVYYQAAPQPVTQVAPPPSGGSHTSPLAAGLMGAAVGAGIARRRGPVVVARRRF